MNESSGIPERLKRVQSIFREVDVVGSDKPFDQLTDEFKENYDDFLSLALEAFAFRLTLDKIGSDKKVIREFLDRFEGKHSMQILAGIGSALVKLKRPISDVSDIVNPSDMTRVANGYGFFCGMFKKGETIEEQKRPTHIKGFEGDFDKGLGRSLWYSSGGFLLLAAKTINEFSPERQADLWTGIGTAFTYVGGFTSADIKQLETVSGNHFRSVREGIESALKSKRKAGTLNNFTRLICKELPGCEEKSKLN